MKIFSYTKGVICTFLFLISYSAFADWTDVSSNIEVTKSKPALDRINRVYFVYLDIKNTGDNVLNSPFRLLIDNSTIPVTGQSGNTESGVPFVDITNESIAVNETVRVRVDFLAQRKALTFDATLQKKVAEPVPIIVSGQVGVTPIKSATVRAMNRSGTLLFTASTDEQGVYAAEMDEAPVDGIISLEVTGGQVNGVPFLGTMKAINSVSDDLASVNVTTLTSIVSRLVDLADRNDAIEQRTLIINNLASIGLLDTQQWSTTNPDNIDIDTITLLLTGNDFDEAINLIVSDLEDGELSARFMGYFPNAHGGIVSATIAGTENTQSVLINQRIQVPVLVNALNSDASFTYSLEASPDWVVISPEGMLTINPSDKNNVNNSYPVTISIVNEDTHIGRVLEGNIYVIPQTESESLIVDANGGEMTNAAGDITIRVPKDAAISAVEITLMVGIDEDGSEIIAVDVSGSLSKPFTLTLPELNKKTEVRQVASVKAKSTYTNRANRAKFSQKNKSGTASSKKKEQSEDGLSTCHKAENNHWVMDRCWLDIEAYFNYSSIYARAPSNIFYIDEGITLRRITASQLWSSESIYTPTLKSRTPVLFVHGYTALNEFGGGEGSFGNFQQFVADLDVSGERFTPFEFQWRTNARFQDVAVDLATTIRLIYQETGQPVHIMAHSFGGVLTRVVLQDLSAKSIDTTNMVASVTSFGTPHSGITDGRQTLHNVTFEGGQDSAAFEVCSQVSCYQMGEHVKIPLNVMKLLNLEWEKGYIAAKLSDTVCELPDDLPFTALLGMKVTGRGNGGNKRALTGDNLISYEGQRFLPQFTNAGYIAEPRMAETLPQCAGKGAVVEELTLGFSEHVKPRDIISDTLQKNVKYWGYSHIGTGGEVYVECSNESNCSHDGWLSAKALLTKYVTTPIETQISPEIFSISPSIVQQNIAADFIVYGDDLHPNILITVGDGSCRLNPDLTENSFTFSCLVTESGIKTIHIKDIRTNEYLSGQSRKEITVEGLPEVGTITQVTLSDEVIWARLNGDVSFSIEVEGYFPDNNFPYEVLLDNGNCLFISATPALTYSCYTIGAGKKSLQFFDIYGQSFNMPIDGVTFDVITKPYFAQNSISGNPHFVSNAELMVNADILSIGGSGYYSVEFDNSGEEVRMLTEDGWQFTLPYSYNTPGSHSILFRLYSLEGYLASEQLLEFELVDAGETAFFNASSNALYLNYSKQIIIEGWNLPKTIAIAIEDAECGMPYDVTFSQAKIDCTPRETGQKRLIIKSKPNGSLILNNYLFNVSLPPA